MDRSPQYPIYLSLAALLVGCSHTAPCRHQASCQVATRSHACDAVQFEPPEPAPTAPSSSELSPSAAAHVQRPAPRNALPTPPLPSESE